MIEIKHLSKTFQMKDGAVNALKDINLTIPDGSIYGIIGMSGAGKSTLVRCINLLERPNGGSAARDLSCFAPDDHVVRVTFNGSSTTLIWWVMTTTVMPSFWLMSLIRVRME